MNSDSIPTKDDPHYSEWLDYQESRANAYLCETEDEDEDEDTCSNCGYADCESGECYEYEDGEPYEDSVWADSNALASAGWGTDEDYGYFGGDDY